jgi:hypothetical protein
MAGGFGCKSEEKHPLRVVHSQIEQFVKTADLSMTNILHGVEKIIINQLKCRLVAA